MHHTFSNIHKKKLSDEEKSSIKFNFFLLQPVFPHIVESVKEGSKFLVVDEKLFSLSQMLQFHSVNAPCVYIFRK